MDENNVMYVNIHGSCVSNDVFRYLLNGSIKVNKYLARSSLISAISEPINIRMDDIKLSSRFQKSMV